MSSLSNELSLSSSPRVPQEAVYYLKQLVSALVILVFIAFTISCALGAQMIRYIDSHNSQGVPCITANTPCTLGGLTEQGLIDCDLDGQFGDCSILQTKKYQLIGSVVNLSLIGIMGQIFLAVADALTAWKNHRTTSEVKTDKHSWQAWRPHHAPISRHHAPISRIGEQRACGQELHFPVRQQLLRAITPYGSPVTQPSSLSTHRQQYTSPFVTAGVVLYRIHARVQRPALGQVTPVRRWQLPAGATDAADGGVHGQDHGQADCIYTQAVRLQVNTQGHFTQMSTDHCPLTTVSPPSLSMIVTLLIGVK